MVKKKNETPDVGTVIPGQVEKPARKRGWVVLRSYDYDMKDPASPYHMSDEQTWRDGVTAEWNTVGQWDGVEWFHFIFHDDDWVMESIDAETGKVTPAYKKKLHVQGVIKYWHSKTQSAVTAHLCGNNTRAGNVSYVDGALGGYLSACQYLTHITQGALDEEKTWYHPRDVISHKARYLDAIKDGGKAKKASVKDERDLCDDLVNKIVSGEIRYSHAKELFRNEISGVGLVRNRAMFDGALAEFRELKTKEFVRLSDIGQYYKRSRYIMGGSQSGKSVLGAQLIIDAKGEGEVFAPGAGGSKKITFDIADGYVDQKGMLLSDFDITMFETTAFYNLVDPKVWVPASSRNSIKPLLIDELVIANAYSFGEMACRLISSSSNFKSNKELYIKLDIAEEFRQVYRRFEQVLDYAVWNNALTGETEHGLMVYLRKERLITGQELYDIYEEAREYRFDENTVNYFFDMVGYVPYDPTWENDIQFRKERLRMAEIINQVSRTNMNVPGFVPGKPFIPMPIDATQDDPIVPVRPAYSSRQLSVFA